MSITTQNSRNATDTHQNRPSWRTRRSSAGPLHPLSGGAESSRPKRRSQRKDHNSNKYHIFLLNALICGNTIVRMRRFLTITLTACLAAAILGCTTVSITGRKQLNLVPDSMMNAMSYQSYRQFIAENRVSTNAAQTQMVKTVGNRIKTAVQQYDAKYGLATDLSRYQWEFNLIEGPEANAWAMPGGKVVVYTGLMPIARDQAGLATVMGHEIAHAIAKHGSERMTQGLLFEMGGMALSKAIETRPAKTQQLFMKSYNIGTTYGVMLPYSRTHEKEADHLGLIFMAMAGYDPHTAIDFWQRMAASKDAAGRIPELLSTHPASGTRIQNIKNLIPEAMQYYKKPR